MLPVIRFGRLLQNVLAGSVRRWHKEIVNQPQSVAEHTFGVLLVLAWVVPEEELTVPLLLAALEHDLAEREVGDIPAQTKWALEGNGLEGLEASARDRSGLPIRELTSEQRRYLDFADCAEAALYAMVEMSRGNQHAKVWYHLLKPKLYILKDLNEQSRALYHAICVTPADTEQDRVLHALRQAGFGQ